MTSLPTAGGAPLKRTINSADSPSSNAVSAGGSRMAMRSAAWNCTVTTAALAVAEAVTWPPPRPTVGAPRVTVSVPAPALRADSRLRKLMSPPVSPAGMTNMPPPGSINGGATSPPTAMRYGIRASAALAADNSTRKAAPAPSSMLTPAAASAAKAAVESAAAAMLSSMREPDVKVTAPAAAAVNSTAKLSTDSARSSARTVSTVSEVALVCGAMTLDSTMVCKPLPAGGAKSSALAATPAAARARRGRMVTSAARLPPANVIWKVAGSPSLSVADATLTATCSGSSSVMATAARLSTPTPPCACATLGRTLSSRKKVSRASLTVSCAVVTVKVSASRALVKLKLPLGIASPAKSAARASAVANTAHRT